MSYPNPPALLHLMLILIAQVPLAALLAPHTVALASTPYSVQTSQWAARPNRVTSWFGEAATFHICSPAEQQTERAIEDFIAGRVFMTVQIGRPDGCADLTIVVFPQLSASSRQSTSLTFSSGSGPAIRVRIVSEHGRTHVSIGGTD